MSMVYLSRGEESIPIGPLSEEEIQMLRRNIDHFAPVLYSKIIKSTNIVLSIPEGADQSLIDAKMQEARDVFDIHHILATDCKSLIDIESNMDALALTPAVDASTASTPVTDVGKWLPKHSTCTCTNKVKKTKKDKMQK